MAQLQELPALNKTFAKLKIQFALGEIPPTCIISTAIGLGINEGKVDETIAMVKDQIADNYEAMRFVLGDKLLADIQNY